MKNEIFEAEHLPNTSRSIWISFYISKLRCANPERPWSKYSGSRHSTLKKWQKWEKMMWKWLTQNSFRITPRRFLDLQDIKKHSKAMWNTLQNHSGASRKNEEISAQTYHSDDFFDLKFSFSPCWRMCCPAGEARGPSENIFPNIEDDRVFWVKRYLWATIYCGEVKNEIFEAKHL